MKCTVCKSKAVLKLPRANASFCKEHFNNFFIKQVKQALRDFRMIPKGARVMVCISGGKDSLVLLKVLHELGYNVFGMYIDLGIGTYSAASKQKVQSFAEKYGLECRIVDLTEKGHPVIETSKTAKRPTCSVCGIMKRYYFNKTALEENADVVATGHNLDDEAARLFGNVINWNSEYLKKHFPVLEDNGRTLKRKIKPLIRLTEQEVAAYAFLNGIDYIAEECPEAKGATSITHKEALSVLEEESPGSKHFFYFEFLRKYDEIFKFNEINEENNAKYCQVCGAESYQDVCSFCRLLEKLNG